MVDIRVGNRAKKDEFIQSVSRKHFLNKRDIRNIHVKVQDRVVIRHQDDAQSVRLAVSELPYNPVMAFKIQGEVHSTLPEMHFFWQYRLSFRGICIENMQGASSA